MGGYLRVKGRVGKGTAGAGVKDLSNKILRIAIANKQIGKNGVKSHQGPLAYPRQRTQQVKHHKFSEQ